MVIERETCPECESRQVSHEVSTAQGSTITKVRVCRLCAERSADRSDSRITPIRWGR